MLNKRQGVVCMFGLWLLLVISAVPVSARTRVIGEIDIGSVAEGVEIRINLNFPLRYVTHTPAARGRLLQIKMSPLFATSGIVELVGRDQFSWQTSADRPLRALTYEGDATGGTLLFLEFDREVEYRIKGGSDPLKLTVLVLSQLKRQPAATDDQPMLPSVVIEQKEILVAPQVVVETAAVDLSHPYAINLESTLGPLEAQLPTLRLDLQKYRLYTSRFKKGAQNWHRLRLGFFSDKKSAQQVMLSLKKEFPDAWLTSTSLEEREASAQTAVYEPVVAIPSTPTYPVAERRLPATAPEVPVLPVEVPVLPAERRQHLLEAAEVSMVAGDYQRAALFYTNLLGAEDAETRQLAQEYLGLARDRANQLAHAKAEYEKYLQLYPEGEGAERVRQRLNALLTARSKPKNSLRKAKQQPGEQAWKHEAYGSFSQFYYHDNLTTDNDENLVVQSSLRSDIDINTRSRSETLDVRTTFIGGVENDFREEGEDDLLISTLYGDVAVRDPEISLRLGRQSRSSGGVLGRFDGGLLRWQLSEKIAASLVGGFPVYSTNDTSIDTDRPLYGISFDLGTLAERWDFNLYVIEQQVGSMTDRRAVGGEIRYFEPTRSFFTLVDYDIFFNELNTALFNGNMRLPDNTILTLSADYRNGPVLTTSNALQGQSVFDIDDLLGQFTKDEIQQLARDRTATSQTYTFGVTRPLNPKLQISGDFALSRFSSTPASGGVEAMDDSGNMYFYSLQLVGSSLIKDGDIAIIGVRYSDTDASTNWAFNLNTRYPLFRELRINPKILVDYRDNKDNSGDRWRMRSALRLEYSWRKRLHLDFEVGAEWADETNAGQNFSTRDFFFTLGYRADF